MEERDLVWEAGTKWQERAESAEQMVRDTRSDLADYVKLKGEMETLLDRYKGLLREALQGWDDWSDTGYSGGEEAKQRISEIRKEASIERELEEKR